MITSTLNIVRKLWENGKCILILSCNIFWCVRDWALCNIVVSVSGPVKELDLVSTLRGSLRTAELFSVTRLICSATHLLSALYSPVFFIELNWKGELEHEQKDQTEGERTSNRTESRKLTSNKSKFSGVNHFLRI